MCSSDLFGTSDPYVEVFVVEGGKQRKLGASPVVKNNLNPDWGTVFQFDFDRRLDQVS